MPELPDIVVYIESLERRVRGQVLQRIRLLSPFVLRSVAPPVADAEGRRIIGLRRLGKRIVIELDEDLFLVLHLMISGRLRWLSPGSKLPGKITLAAFDFPDGTLAFTEAGTKKRASLHLVRGEAGLAQFDLGGLDVMAAVPAEFGARLIQENHTLKRALTDPHLFSGIGNAYSDEILHRARLSPITLTATLGAEEIDGCSKRRVMCWPNGRFDFGNRMATASPNTSLPSGQRWLSTAALANLVRRVLHRCSASSTRKTSATTARGARPMDGCWQIAPCLACCTRIGHAPSTSWIEELSAAGNARRPQLGIK